MTAFGKLIRTTAFRLTLVYLFLFALFAASLLGYFAWNTRRMITEQITDTVNSELGELTDQYTRGGLRGLVAAVEGRALRPGANLYLVTTPQGQGVAGNVASLEPGVMDHPGWAETFYKRLEETDTKSHFALVKVSQLSGGFRILVGRDLEERRRLFAIVAKAAQWSVLIVVVLGLSGGVFVARRVLRRIDAMTGTTQRIMAGDLSERLPVGRSGDEIDRLAENLNAMLERIEALMVGLKEVSDNIAHDLKTPLTRLRSAAEAALMDARGPDAYQEGLEHTIEKADELIKTFNALLLVARLEAGVLEENAEAFDVGRLVHDVAELYEPVAEERGLALELKAAEAVRLTGNRQLVGQAVANLVDNAIKYSAKVAKTEPRRAATITVGLKDCGDTVEIAVADQGPGVAAQDRERVLKRFVRLEKSRTEPGTGLGLSLVQAVAHLHGGNVRLEDNAPGLKVVLTLPKRMGEA